MDEQSNTTEHNIKTVYLKNLQSFNESLVDVNNQIEALIQNV